MGMLHLTGSMCHIQLIPMPRLTSVSVPDRDHAMAVGTGGDDLVLRLRSATATHINTNPGSHNGRRADTDTDRRAQRSERDAASGGPSTDRVWHTSGLWDIRCAAAFGITGSSMEDLRSSATRSLRSLRR